MLSTARQYVVYIVICSADVRTGYSLSSLYNFGFENRSLIARPPISYRQQSISPKYILLQYFAGGYSGLLRSAG